MFRSVVFMFPDVSFVAPRFHAGIDHHKGCRPEQLASVASLPASRDFSDGRRWPG